MDDVDRDLIGKIIASEGSYGQLGCIYSVTGLAVIFAVLLAIFFRRSLAFNALNIATASVSLGFIVYFVALTIVIDARTRPNAYHFGVAKLVMISLFLDPVLPVSLGFLIGASCNLIRGNSRGAWMFAFFVPAFALTAMIHLVLYATCCFP